MADIDEVLERLVADGDFRAALARDPAAALAGYDLTREDVELLASRLDDGDDAERTVEQRTSKSAMLALLASFAGPGGGGAAGPKHEDQIQVLSWSWGETQGGDAAADDLAVPDDAADALYNKSKGKVEYTWKVEEGVKSEVDPDALTHKVEPGGTAPGAPSTDDEGIIVINGLEDDSTAEMENVGLNYGKVEYESEPLDPALADAEDEPEAGFDAFLKIGDIKGEARDPAASLPEDDPTDLGGVKAEVDPDALTQKVEPGDDGGDEGIIIVGGKPEADGADEVSWSWGETSDGAAAIPPDDGAVGGVPPDDSLVGGNPPDDGLEGVTPPDDGVAGAIPPDDSIVGGNPPDDSIEGVAPPDNGVVGAIPPDDNIVGSTPPDDNLGGRTDVTAAMDADDVMEIEDM